MNDDKEEGGSGVYLNRTADFLQVAIQQIQIYFNIHMY